MARKATGETVAFLQVAGAGGSHHQLLEKIGLMPSFQLQHWHFSFPLPLEIAFCQAGLVVARSCGLCQEVAVLELHRLGRQVSMPNAYVCARTAQVVSLG